MSRPAGIQPLAGAIICGGDSMRMGTDKAAMAFRGQPLWQRVAERLSRVADPILLAPGTPGRLGDTGLAEVPDTLGLVGPMAGVVPALNASPHPLVAVVAVDLPFCDPELLTRLAVMLSESTDLACIPVTSDGPQPLHGVYRKGAAARLQDLGRNGTSGLIAAMRSMEVTWLKVPGGFEANLNTPADVDVLEAGHPDQT